MKHNKMTKLLVLALAVMMAVSMLAVPVLAEEPVGEITIYFSNNRNWEEPTIEVNSFPDYLTYVETNQFGEEVYSYTFDPTGKTVRFFDLETGEVTVEATGMANNVGYYCLDTKTGSKIDLGTYIYTPTSGTCGTSATWAYDAATGTLTIGGSGDLGDGYYTPTNCPWNDYRSTIKKVIIGKDITEISGYSFDSCRELTEVVIETGSKLETIGQQAFAACQKLEKISTLPGALKTIKGSAFFGCSVLTNIYYDGTEDAWDNVTGNTNVPGAATIHCLVAPVLPAAHTHCVCGDHDCTDATHEKITYLPWSEAIGNRTGLSGGTYNVYLDSNVTLTRQFTLTKGAVLNLCLNGYALNVAGNLIKVGSAGDLVSLNLCDCGTAGKVTGGVEYAAFEIGPGMLTMYSGAISGNTNRAIYMQNSAATVKILGGTIFANSTTQRFGGGAIYVQIGDLTVAGDAVISGNSAPNGGAIATYPENGTVTVSIGGNAVIKGNVATGSGGAIYTGAGGGSGIYGPVTISDNAKIRDNAANRGGALYIYGGATTISDNVQIIGNRTVEGSFYSSNARKYYYYGAITYEYASADLTITDNVTIYNNYVGDATSTTQCNLSLRSGRLLDLTGLGTGAKIGIWYVNDKLPDETTPLTVSTANAAANAHKQLKSDNAGYSFINNEGVVQMIAGAAPHDHVWTYTAFGDTVSAKCEGEGECDYSGGDLFLTVIAPEKTAYADGKSAEATLSGTTLVGQAAPAIVYAEQGAVTALAEAPEGVGSYTASITVGGATATVNYTIEKGTLTADDFAVTLPSSLEYNGRMKFVSVNAKDGVVGVGTVTEKYFSESGVWMENPPKDVGTYTVKLDVSEGTNYKAADDLSDDSWTFTITPKDIVPSIEIDIPEGGFVYDGTAKEPNVTVMDGDDVIDASEYFVWYNNNVNAGTASLIVANTTGGNYVFAMPGDFEIAKADLTVKPLAASKVYGEEDPAFVGYTCTGMADSEAPIITGAFSREEGEDVGQYAILPGTLTVSDNFEFKLSNYNVNIVVEGVYFTITAKELTDPEILIAAPVDGYIYDGTAKKPDVVVMDGETVIDASEYTVSYEDNINAGTATVVITDNDGGNYTVSGSATFPIEKAIPTWEMFDFQAPADLAYDGSMKMPTITVKDGIVGMGEINDIYFWDSTASTVDPINVGRYTAFIRLAEGENYLGRNDISDPEGVAWTFYITPAPVTIDMSGITPTEKVYDSQSFSYSGAAAGVADNTAKAYEGEFAYTWHDAEGNELAEAPKNAGSYILRATVTDPNFQGSADLTITIQKKPALVRPVSFEATEGDRAPVLAIEFIGLVPGESVGVTPAPALRIMHAGNAVISLDRAMRMAGNYTVFWSNFDETTFIGAENYDITVENKGTLKVHKRFIDTIVIQRKLSFETNGGSDLADVIVVNGTTIDLAKYQPTREGYTFMGWYLDARLTTPATKVAMYANMTVYAAWMENVKPVEPTEPFTDVKIGDWYYSDVQYVFERGLMRGVSTGVFGPEIVVNRGMVVEILYRMEGSPAVSGSCPFPDVKAGSYYENAIIWAEQNGVIGGYPDGTFGPEDKVTREQLAKMLYGYAQYKGEGFTGMWMFRLDYADADQVGDWAYESMCYMTMNGVITGKGGDMLDPKGDATRMELAAMLHRFCLMLEK